MSRVVGRKKRKLENSTKIVALSISIGGALLVLAIVLPITLYFANLGQDEEEVEPKGDPEIPPLAEMVARTDQSNTKWRLGALKNRLPNLPPANNGANYLEAQVKPRIPDKALAAVIDELKKLPPITKYPNAQLTATEKSILSSSVPKAQTVIAGLYNVPPNGRFDIKYTANIYKTPLPHLADLENYFRLLEADALLKLQQGNPVEADKCIRSLFRLCNYLRYEPHSMSQLRRIEGQMIAMNLIERLLGHTQFPKELDESYLLNYQSELSGSLAHKEFLEMVRIERASFHDLCTQLRTRQVKGWPGAPSGSIYSKAESGSDGGMGMDYEEELGDDLGTEEDMEPEVGPDGCGGEEFPEFDEPTQPVQYVQPPVQTPQNPMPQPPTYQHPDDEDSEDPSDEGDGGPPPEGLDLENALFLQYMNQIVNIAKGDSSIYVASIKKWDEDSPKIPSKIKSYIPKNEMLALIYLRKLARMRCALIGVAAERYRLHYKKWPGKLQELTIPLDPEDPKTRILPSIPLDPFTGQALYYRPTSDGVVIYSTGEDLRDNQGEYNPEAEDQAGSDIVFRLFNLKPNERRQPPPAPIPLPAGA